MRSSTPSVMLLHRAVGSSFVASAHFRSKSAVLALGAIRFCREISIRDRKRAIPPARRYAARMLNCSASEGCGLRAYFACCLRIM